MSDRKAAKHDERPKPRELLDPRQLKVVEVYQAKSGPEESLARLPQTEIWNLKLDIKYLLFKIQIKLKFKT